MRKHSSSKPSKKHAGPRPRTVRRPPASRRIDHAPTGFLQAWNGLLDGFVPRLPKRRGRRPQVPLAHLLAALTFHFMNGAGTLAQHFFQLFGHGFADSSWSDRRRRLPWDIFADLMRRALRPRATRRQRQSFWRQWRLVALDGTQFSLTNTPQIKQHSAKARSRRGRAAFAKLWTVVLLEVGLHNPLAAAIGRGGQSEWELARGLLAQLPRQALLLADRLYGCVAFVAEVLPACQRVGSHFLFRVRSNIQTQTLRRHKDGSRLVRVGLRHKNNPNRIAQWLEVREIRVRVARPGFRPHAVRLWTSLLPWKEAPAQELARLYTQRWEHELYYREIKRQLRRTEVLQSHTLETAAQEIAAIILASALVAIQRARAATGQTPVLRVSFVKVLELLRPLWLTLAACDDLLSQEHKNEMAKRLYQLMGQCVSPPKRSRRCPRAVRRPVTGWPRLRRNESIEGPIQLHIL